VDSHWRRRTWPVTDDAAGSVINAVAHGSTWYAAAATDDARLIAANGSATNATAAWYVTTTDGWHADVATYGRNARPATNGHARVTTDAVTWHGLTRNATTYDATRYVIAANGYGTVAGHGDAIAANGNGTAADGRHAVTADGHVTATNGYALTAADGRHVVAYGRTANDGRYASAEHDGHAVTKHANETTTYGRHATTWNAPAEHGRHATTRNASTEHDGRRHAATYGRNAAAVPSPIATNDGRRHVDEPNELHASQAPLMRQMSKPRLQELRLQKVRRHWLQLKEGQAMQGNEA